MGHATVVNLSKLINRELKKGPVTIKALIDLALEKKLRVRAAEGDYMDAPMLGKTIEEILGVLNSDGFVDPQPKSTKQRRVWKEYERGESVDWDTGEDGRGGEQGIFDSIKWYPLRKRIAIIRQISS